MIAELAHFCTVLALIMALVLAAAGIVAGAGGGAVALRIARRSAYCLAVLILAAMAGLIMVFVLSDFSVRSVVMHSHTAKPLIYKIAAAWGFHEGSMLLWVLILSVLACASALLARYFPEREAGYALGVQGIIAAAFISFILLTSNPFARLAVPPVQGSGFNPILQDPALAVHPPMLYLGYVGFSALFAFAVAAMGTGQIDAGWARRVRPLVFLAWTALSAGIALGAFWAYYELGWGGWWFWDPVENASLMPWLTGTALLHSLSVMEKRGGLKSWTLLLASLTFLLSVLGTFLVRSGLLTSVHSFASDPERGIYILMMLALFGAGAFLLFGLRWSSFAMPGQGQGKNAVPGSQFAPVSREGALVLNNLFMSVMAATVLIGTLYPLAMQAFNVPPVTVGPPYFHFSVIPVAVLALIVMSIGPLMRSTQADIKALGRKLARPALAVLAALLVLWWLGLPGGIAGTGALALGIWCIAGAFAHAGSLSAGARGHGVRARMRTLYRLPGGNWAVLLAHGGMGVAVLGMAGIAFLSVEKQKLMTPGAVMHIAGLEIAMTDIDSVNGPNYRGWQARLAVRHDGNRLYTLRPGKRDYRATDTRTSEAGIATRPFYTLYSVAARTRADQRQWMIRVRYQPLAPFLWPGFAIIVLGGIIGTLAGLRRLKDNDNGYNGQQQAGGGQWASASLHSRP